MLARASELLSWMPKVIWCGVNRPKKTRMFPGYMNCTKHTFGDSAEANLEN